ncbi:hypothetical protein LCGC14_2660240 [marine sediment metagenome]|uniref:Uncharacterized protein n=1 Tax=marine sediment metagenome TaxID=412755 RepID=A0A0F9AEH3_9ZZZZ
MNRELKPCPCCGNVNITCENMSRTTQRPFWVISCCVQSRRLSKKDCVERWNKRPESAWEKELKIFLSECFTMDNFVDDPPDYKSLRQEYQKAINIMKEINNN